MSIFKRGNVYWYHFIFDGKHVQKSTKQGNPRTARQMEAAYRTALAKGEVGIIERRRVPGFKTAMRDFLAWSEKQHTEHPATYRRYQVSSAALLRHFGDQPLDRITPQDVEAFKARRSKDKGQLTNRLIKPGTINRELACMKALFNHAIKSELPLRNPVSRVGFLPEQNEQTRVIAYAEQERYLAFASPMLRDIVTIMLSTGMRPEEVYRIRQENVHITESYLFNPFGKTKAARRRVPLTAEARAVLMRRLASGEKYLFPCETDHNRPVPKMNNAHDRALIASKVAPFRLYDCRHTWATRAAESGIDLVTLAALLGHSKIQMVLRYAHPSQEHQTQAVGKLERFVIARQLEARLPEHTAALALVQ